MGIGEQFTGLDMSNLIGGPLTAAAEASVLLAQSTADFINQVGFDKNNGIRTAQFKFFKQEPDPDGNVTQQELSVDIPMLAIVPIPNLQIDEVNILFDMEVKQSERSENSLDVGASLEANIKIGPFGKVAIKGSVSAHQSNTRSSDNSAKYHVDLRATNHGIPEGLARVLDMMAANVAPSLVSSRPTDPSGNELTGASKQRNLKLRAIREQQLQLERAESAAGDTYATMLKSVKEQAKFRCKALLTKLQANATEAGEDEKKLAEATQGMEATSSFWDDFLATVENHMQGLAADENPQCDLGKYYALSDVLKSSWGVSSEYDWSIINSEFKKAVAAYRNWHDSTEKVDKNRTEYNSTMMSGTALTVPSTAPAQPD